jgi:hypothetical protein
MNTNEIQDKVAAARAELARVLAEAELAEMMSNPIAYRAKIEAEARAKVLSEKISNRRPKGSMNALAENVLGLFRAFPNAKFNMDRIVGDLARMGVNAERTHLNPVIAFLKKNEQIVSVAHGLYSLAPEKVGSGN